MRGAFRSLRVLSPDMLRAFCLASVSLERKNLFLDLTGGDRLIRDVGLQNRPDEYCAVRVAGVGSHARQRVEEKRLSIVRPTAALPYSERELNPHKPFGLTDFKSDASTDSAIRACPPLRLPKSEAEATNIDHIRLKYKFYVLSHILRAPFRNADAGHRIAGPAMFCGFVLPCRRLLSYEG